MRTLPACVFATALLATASVAFADTVLLKNGQSITGTWVKADDKTITLQVDKKEQTVNLADVFRVTFGTPSAIDTIVIEDVKYEVIEAKAGSDSLTIRMMATNQGSDATVTVCRSTGTRSRCGRSYVGFTDESGRSYQASQVMIANKPDESSLVNGVRTPITVEFKALPTKGGTIEAVRIEKLELAPLRQGARTAAKGEFRDLAIRK